MPIMLQSALTSNAFIASQMLALCFPSNLFVKILGIWEVCGQLFFRSIDRGTDVFLFRF
jgi:hypothetical protein